MTAARVARQLLALLLGWGSRRRDHRTRPDAGPHEGSTNLGALDRFAALGIGSACVALILVAGAVQACGGSGGERAPVEAPPVVVEEEPPEPETVGCLDRAGRHAGFEDEIRDRLKDPDSFTHLQTETGTEVIAGEEWGLLMVEFTATNDFGGRLRSWAYGIYDLDSCVATLDMIN